MHQVTTKTLSSAQLLVHVTLRPPITRLGNLMAPQHSELQASTVMLMSCYFNLVLKRQTWYERSLKICLMQLSQISGLSER